MAADQAVATSGFVESADRTQLAYRAWPQASAGITFAVVHGQGEHAGRYDHFARGMAKHGMGTYAVDLRGHGRSPGQRGHVDSWAQWTDDAAAFVKHVESAAGGEVVPVGHSFGGAAILSTLLAGKLHGSRRFIVSSPALELRVPVPGWLVSFARMTSRLAPRLALNNKVDPKLISRIPEVVEAYRSDPLVHNRISTRLFTEWQNATRDILARAGEISIPFLILAGTDDLLIDPHGSEELHQRAPVSQLHLLAGRYHEPFNDVDSEEVFELIARWLTAS